MPPYMKTIVPVLLILSALKHRIRQSCMQKCNSAPCEMHSYAKGMSLTSFLLCRAFQQACLGPLARAQGWLQCRRTPRMPA